MSDDDLTPAELDRAARAAAERLLDAMWGE